VSKYHRNIPIDEAETLAVDVYDILTAFDVRCPAIQHAIKKLLMPGQRGHKSRGEDLREAIQSIERAIELDIGKSVSQ
jgi:hypothetical protein